MANNKVDYTGASAQQYIDKYTDRPEDAANLEDIQNMLSDMGVVPGVGEPADLLNSLLYGAQGKGGEALLSLLSMIPFLGAGIKGVKKTGKAHDVINKIIARNKKSIGNILNKMLVDSGKISKRLRRTYPLPKDPRKFTKTDGWKGFSPGKGWKSSRKKPRYFGEPPPPTGVISPEALIAGGAAGAGGSIYGMESFMDNPLIGKLVEFMMSDPDTEGSSRMDLYHGMPDLRLEKFK